MRINELDNIPKLIQKNCSQILSLMTQTKGMLLSGIRPWDGPSGEGYGGIFQGQSPINRAPVLTLPKYDKLINKKLAKAGFKALRLNSLFCKVNYQSNSYGKLHLILPFNGFDYTWAPYSDLTIQFGLDSLSEQWPSSEYGQECKEFKTDLDVLSPEMFVQKYKFRHDHLEWAMDETRTITFYEVYIHGNYYAIPYERDLINQYLAPLLPNIDFIVF